MSTYVAAIRKSARPCVMYVSQVRRVARALRYEQTRYTSTAVAIHLRPKCERMRGWDESLRLRSSALAGAQAPGCRGAAADSTGTGAACGK